MPLAFRSWRILAAPYLRASWCVRTSAKRWLESLLVLSNQFKVPSRISRDSACGASLRESSSRECSLRTRYRSARAFSSCGVSTLGGSTLPFGEEDFPAARRADQKADAVARRLVARRRVEQGCQPGSARRKVRRGLLCLPVVPRKHRHGRRLARCGEHRGKHFLNPQRRGFIAEALAVPGLHAASPACGSAASRLCCPRVLLPPGPVSLRSRRPSRGSCPRSPWPARDSP